MKVVVLVCCLVLLAGCNEQDTGAHPGASARRETREGTAEHRPTPVTTDDKTMATHTVPIMPMLAEGLRDMAALEPSVSQASCWPLWKDAVRRRPVTANPLAMRCAVVMGYHFAFAPPLGGPMALNEPQALVYANAALAHVVRVNTLASVLAAELAAAPRRDVESAHAELHALLRAQTSQLLRVYTLMAHFSQEPGVLERSGTTPGVDFTRGAYHLNLSAHGTTLHYAGVPWFGQGVLSGKRYEMQLVAMTDMRLVPKHTIGQGGEPKAETRVITHAGGGK
jgi:hypothetical protein